MSAPTQELRDFHRFLGEKLTNGGVELSPEAALDEWRRIHPESLDEDAAATPKTFGERYAEFKGAVPDLPTDLAEQHEHYRLGKPKR